MKQRPVIRKHGYLRKAYAAGLSDAINRHGSLQAVREKFAAGHPQPPLTVTATSNNLQTR